MSTISFLLAVGVTLAVVAGNITVDAPFVQKLSWFHIGSVNISMGVLIDPLTAMMLMVVTTVSLLVQIYSCGYMEGDPGYGRFFAFLSLFAGSMLGLVLAVNFLQMYFFWELVGLCSYLLIGFYYYKISAREAAKKAFMTTRVGDFGLLLGILLLQLTFGTLDFMELQQLVPIYVMHGGAGFLTIIALLLFVGPIGKSGQFPLHVWLPDAMEGPTPVSALIHAATMVVAGVFQVARMFPLWIQYAPDTLHIVAWVGAFTAFYAAAVACAQSDIKRVLAFSTISQIAFMMVALGVCTEITTGHEHPGSLGYMASMYHLFTHAMFKALLFLGAGCIIHAVHSNEMSAMGGLRKYMPVTHITFLIACLAISGIPPFSGFFSKDEILTACFAFSPAMGWIMTGIAAMTAFYMFRLYCGIFWGTENKELHAEHTPHEAPLTMTLPLVFLALVTVFVGWTVDFGHFVSADGRAYDIHLDPSVAITSIVIALCSIGLAIWIYGRDKQPVADALATRFASLHKWAYHRFYMDEVYQFVTHRIIFAHISKPIAWFDRHVVDGFFNFLAWGTNALSFRIRGLQSGRVQQYAMVFFIGVLILILILIF